MIGDGGSQKPAVSEGKAISMDGSSGVEDQRWIDADTRRALCAAEICSRQDKHKRRGLMRVQRHIFRPQGGGQKRYGKARQLPMNLARSEIDAVRRLPTLVFTSGLYALSTSSVPSLSRLTLSTYAKEQRLPDFSSDNDFYVLMALLGDRSTRSRVAVKPE